MKTNKKHEERKNTIKKKKKRLVAESVVRKLEMMRLKLKETKSFFLLNQSFMVFLFLVNIIIWLIFGNILIILERFW